MGGGREWIDGRAAVIGIGNYGCVGREYPVVHCLCLWSTCLSNYQRTLGGAREVPYNLKGNANLGKVLCPVLGI